MTNSEGNIENLVDICNDIKNFNIKNCTDIPTDWIKCGEIFYNKLEQPIFICSICLQNADSIKTAYNTSDGSVLWWHIQQQHMSVEYETIDKISAEIQSYEKNKVAFDNSHGEINTKESNHVDFVNNEMKQNEINMLEVFHEKVVKSNCTQKTKETLRHIDINTETVQTQEGEQLNDSKGINLEEDAKLNAPKGTEKYVGNFSNCNYYNDNNETYTISDDEDEGQGESEDQGSLTTNSESNVRDYLKHNDMIEISDDEDSIDTLPTSSTLIDENTATRESVDKILVDTNTHINFNVIRENIPNPTTSVTCIPTPDVSPCESLATKKYTCSSGDNENPQSTQVQGLSKRRVKNFRAFKCELCGCRTIKERNMQNHLEKFHQSVLQKFGTNQNYHQYYRQLHPFNQNEKHHLKRNPFNCKVCKRRMETVESMERHQQLNHGPDVPPLAKQCDICLKRVLPQNFQMHMQLHFSATFNCIHCGVVCKHKRYLDNHICKYHAGENLSLPSLSVQQPAMINMPFEPFRERQLGYQGYDQMWGHLMSSNNALPAQYPR